MEQLDRIKYTLEEAMPLHKLLKTQVLALEHGYIKLFVPFQELVLGNVASRYWHGGILATFLDAAGGAAAATTLTTGFVDDIATIDMRVDYLQGAKDEDIFVESTVLRRGNKTIVTTMQVTQDGNTIADGRGVYNVRARKRSSL